MHPKQRQHRGETAREESHVLEKPQHKKANGDRGSKQHLPLLRIFRLRDLPCKKKLSRGRRAEEKTESPIPESVEKVARREQQDILQPVAVWNLLKDQIGRVGYEEEDNKRQ